MRITTDPLGAFGGVMDSKLDYPTYTSEFESHWVPLSYGLVPHLSKKLSKLRSQQIRFCGTVGLPSQKILITLFGVADRSDSVQIFDTEILNSIPQVCIKDKGTKMIG